MILSRSFFLATILITLLFTTASCDSKPSPFPKPKSEAEADYQAFQKLLQDVDENKIHSVLHSWSTKFRDGIFSKDRTAIEAVHSEDAPLATRLINIAKRQNGNGTVVTVNPTSTAIVSPQSSAAPVNPEQPSSSATVQATPAPQPVPGSSSPNGAPTSAAAVPQPKTTLAPPSTPSGAVAVSTDTAGGVVFSSTGGAGGLVTLASSKIIFFSSSPGESFHQVSSTILSTTTLPDGSQSTITAVTVVNAPDTGVAPTPSGTAGANPTGTGGSPGLQKGAASASIGMKKEMLAMMGGAVVVAMAL